MRMDIERHWYSRSLTALTLWLLPLSWIFYGIITLRSILYRNHIKKSQHFPVPIIVVGNITVGGTGKTPLVIWLTHWLRAQGYRPGIVSRGVGGQQSKHPRSVLPDSLAEQVGDEALLLAKRSQCPVMLCIDRVAAVNMLLATTDCNIVIADDGLQHYRLARDIEIAVIDGDRRFGNACLLPAGPLREPISRLQHVDFVMVQGIANDNEFAMSLRGDEWVSVMDAEMKKPFSSFKKAHAFAAIGNPERFFTRLRQAGIDVIPHYFQDHYRYRACDFDLGDDLPILMTEKDAVKCQDFADDRFWYLPVDMQVDPLFENQLLAKLTRRN